MTKPNHLLEDAILQDIEKARYVASKPEKDNKSWFYLIILFLVTLATVLSLFL